MASQLRSINHVRFLIDERPSQFFQKTGKPRGDHFLAADCAKLPKVRIEVQREELRSSARTLLSQAYLAGLRFPDVLKALKEAAVKAEEASAKNAKPSEDASSNSVVADKERAGRW